MTAPVEPWQLRKLAVRDSCPDDARAMLRAAADELVGLRRQVEAWKEAHAAALALVDEQAEVIEQFNNNSEGGQ